MAVTLKEIAEATNAIMVGASDTLVSDITNVSSQCLPGSIFVAIKGYKVDGNNFIDSALKHGAVGVISEKPCPAGFSGNWLQVVDARLALAQASAAIFGYPSRRLKLVGITGTNGKTTTAHLVDSMIRAAYGLSAMIGTISYRIGNEERAAQHTTPEAPEIQRLLRRAFDAGCRAAVMEASSHAIDLKRVHGCRFDVAVFTNLTQDHLDYHLTIDEYFAVKRRLFDGSLGSSPRVAVINVDDPRGAELVKVSKGRVITYGIYEGADVKTSDFSLSPAGLSFKAETPIGELDIISSLVGRPHVYNILAAIGAGLALGFDKKVIERGILGCRSVPGRFESVDTEEDFAVIVDYAHTPDALRNVLQTAREITRRRVITVFGCGGDRDRTKRPIMGAVAGSMSDVVIVTSDNPRSEDPEAIISEIEDGLRRIGCLYHKITDRRDAIEFAINLALPGDLVLLAGKGHETYQVLKDRTIDFDDREVARQALSARHARHSGVVV